MRELMSIDTRFKEMYEDYIIEYMNVLDYLDGRPDYIFSSATKDVRQTRQEFMSTLLETLDMMKQLDIKYEEILRLHSELSMTTWITIVVNRVRVLHDHIRRCVTAQHHGIQETGKMKTTWHRSYILSRTYIDNHLGRDGKC